MSPILKEILSAAAIALTLVAFLPYLRAIIKRTAKPHVFSWVIWGSTTFVVFLAQLADGGAALVLGLSACPEASRYSSQFWPT